MEMTHKEFEVENYGVIEQIDDATENIAYEIIGAAIEVHRNLGPRLLESTYENCLDYELQLRNLEFKRQVTLPIKYKTLVITGAYRLDFLVADSVIIELKSSDNESPIFESQVLTYLKLTKIRLGLLINFNVKYLRNGIKRIVL
jgi:GxxExxY protein